MKENKYDDKLFFDQYSKMSRSVNGLNGAGEWHVLKNMLPNLKNKKVLDLGCGFGWHCKYAVENGADSVLGIDISKKMLSEAIKRNSASNIEYKCMAIEDFEFLPNTFDVVISSLTFHYLESFDIICKKVSNCLTDNGVFVFSVEHPIFTAYGTQDWYYSKEGDRLHWPIDNYSKEGKREAVFLGEEVVKYHKTLATYIKGLITNKFIITDLQEPLPSNIMLESNPEMKEELRRPMMLLISAQKSQ